MDTPPDSSSTPPSAPGQPRPPLNAAGLAAPPPPPPYAPMMFAPPPPRRGGGRIVAAVVGTLIAILLIFSLALNTLFVWREASAIRGPTEVSYQRGDGEPAHRIVILPVTGGIDDTTSAFIRESLVELRANPPKAVILRVDSPGGTVSASDRIAHELDTFRQESKLPIVASFGGVAASGGYYISAAADHIFAEPSTLTGSIGVIAEAFTVPDLLVKVGVTPEIVTSTPATKKDMLSPFRAWTDADRAVLRSILDEDHALFVRTVYEGRKSKNLTQEKLAELANGSVYTTEAAIKNNLIDGQGFLADAIAKARELAHMDAAANPDVMMMQPARRLGWRNMLDAAAPLGGDGMTTDQLRRLLAESMALSVRFQMTP